MQQQRQVAGLCVFQQEHTAAFQFDLRAMSLFISTRAPPFSPPIQRTETESMTTPNQRTGTEGVTTANQISGIGVRALVTVSLRAVCGGARLSRTFRCSVQVAF